MRLIDCVKLTSVAFALLLASAGCGSGDKTTDQKPATNSTAETPTSPPKVDSEVALARVLVIDMDGKPLANMLPIVTAKANAFDKPIATGQPTGDDGRGYVTISGDQWVYVRAWDPVGRVFANNYYDVLPGNAKTTDVMQIVMVPGASLSAVLVDGQGTPFADTAVGMMMSHPTRGPWWPAESKTNGSGKVVFESVPAGHYQITLETATGQQIDLPDVSLPPGGSADLGPVALQ
jgi:hypothetical protein